MIGVYIKFGPATDEQYHAVDNAVRERGVSDAGLMVHTAFREGEELAVFDVWESKEAFLAFAAQLAPIVEEVGGPGPEPMFVEMLDYVVR